jgi:hypothetical protein
MDAAANPQMIIIGSLIAILLVALIARHFDQRRQPDGAKGRFGDSHSQAITEMGNRTRAEAQRKERELTSATTPTLSR